MAIKFHYHTAARAVPRLGIRRGDPCCHVYSDTSVEELLRWAEARGFEGAWLDRRNALPHFDAFGRWLRFCGRSVTRAELVRDLRRCRARRARRSSSPSPATPSPKPPPPAGQ